MGAMLLLSDWRKAPGERSVVAILFGVIALVVGLFYAAVFIALNGMMHR